jgi:hypothetical protein
LSTNLRLGLYSGLFPSGFPNNILIAFLFSPIRATCPTHIIPLDLIIKQCLLHCLIQVLMNLASF